MYEFICENMSHMSFVFKELLSSDVDFHSTQYTVYTYYKLQIIYRSVGLKLECYTSAVVLQCCAFLFFFTFSVLEHVQVFINAHILYPQSTQSNKHSALFL